MIKNAFSLADSDQDTPRVAWSPDTDDLHMNVVVLRPYEGIPAHTNQSLDVILTCLQGTGVVTIDEEPTPISAGSIVLIPCGSERQITANDETLVYTTVHRKRGGLMPTVHQ